MRRREFIGGLIVTAATWPLTVRAKQPVIGFLSSTSPPGADAQLLTAFRQGLSETGYVEGQNVAIEYRWADDQKDRLPALVADLIHRQVSLIVAPDSTPAAVAAKAATTTIPIVFRIGTDPVDGGLVTSLNRPGGNLTGVTTLGLGLATKRLELLRELTPTATVMALLVNPTDPDIAENNARVLHAAAGTLGLELHVLRASTEREIDMVFANLSQLRVGGLVIGGDAFFNSRSEKLATVALRYAVSAIYQFREFAAAGGLMSYGSSLADGYRLAGVYTGRILKGEKPADLPIVQSAKIELILNMKTANALGLTIPPSIMVRADEVIE
jgi:putative ABC transport system substrate-binding protein